MRTVGNFFLIYRIKAEEKAQNAIDIAVVAKQNAANKHEKLVKEYDSVQLALQALADCESDKLVNVALLKQNCCLFVCSVSALRDYRKRLAFVGGEEYARIPSQLFQSVCGVGLDGYEPWKFKRYSEYLQKKNLNVIKSYRFKKCEGFKSNKSNVYYFHLSRIFTNLQEGTILLICGFSLPPTEREEYRDILVAKKEQYRNSGNRSVIEIEQYIEIYSEKEILRPGSPLFEMWLAFVEDKKRQSRHVCAVSKDLNGVVHKDDNTHHNRKPISGLEDLLPYTFYHTETFAFDIEV